MWSKITAWFKDSETIFLARLQTFAGIAIGAFLALDPALFQQYVPVEYVPIYLLAMGIVTEIARRRRDPEMRK